MANNGWGGVRPNAGRPSQTNRCSCGRFTLETARKLYHHCPPASKSWHDCTTPQALIVFRDRYCAAMRAAFPNLPEEDILRFSGISDAQLEQRLNTYGFEECLVIFRWAIQNWFCIRESAPGNHPVLKNGIWSRPYPSLAHLARYCFFYIRSKRECDEWELAEAVINGWYEDPPPDIQEILSPAQQRYYSEQSRYYGESLTGVAWTN